LYCEGLALAAIAERVGTPAYVYSAELIRNRYRQLADALAGLPVHIHYSVKANSSLGILALLRSLGAGVDIVSGGELGRALLAGFTGEDIVFSGVGKTRHELDRAVAAGLRSINVESDGELRELQCIAQRHGSVVPVVLRVNPEIVVDTPHRYTRTAEPGMKFGIPHDAIVAMARTMRDMPNVQLVGLATHVGSQVGGVEAYAQSAYLLVELKRQIEQEGVASITTLDLGGGLALVSDDDRVAYLAEFAAAVAIAAEAPDVQVIIEPGRFIVADAGVLLTRVLYRKRSGGKEIVIADAAMNDFIRPSLYDSVHGIDVVDGNSRLIRANVVGPVCESGDFFAIDREMPDVEPGDLLAIRAAGAYGYSMASNYNSRPRPVELLVDGEKFAIITERESDVDLTRRETAAPQWIED
jgi:diaminopimelate decarboxylase